MLSIHTVNVTNKYIVTTLLCSSTEQFLLSLSADTQLFANLLAVWASYCLSTVCQCSVYSLLRCPQVAKTISECRFK